MADEKKLSLKERLAEKNALKKSEGGAKQTISKADFEKKQEENRILEEQRLKELERKKKEEERVRLEAEAKAAEEAARKKAEQEAEYLKQKRELELKEKEEAIKAISGETDAGKLGRGKSDYVILAVAILFSLGLAYPMGRIFMERKAKNDTIEMAKKSLPVFERADAVLDKYDKYFRNHKNERIDFGAGDILGKLGEPILLDDDFMKLPTYAASFYGYGTMVGKNVLKYVQLYSSLVRASSRLRALVSNKKNREILEKVNDEKQILKITDKTVIATFNSPYPLPQNKEYVIPMGEMVQILGVYEPTAEEKKAMAAKRKKMVIRNVQSIRVILLNDTAKLGEFVVPNLYFTPINNPYKYFQTLKPEYVKYQELYNTIKTDWKDISAIRENIKKDLKKKANSPKLPMAF
jgi:hypothetical protein